MAVLNVVLLTAALASTALAQAGAWQQCGGTGYQGSKTCVSGYTCQYSSQYYSQCVPGKAATTLKTSTKKSSGGATKTNKPSSPSTPKPVSGGGKLKLLGASESGAEWGTAMPGTLNKDYVFPSTSTIDTLISEGMNIFRVPFAMERMAQGSITAPINSAYLSGYSAVINHITSKGAKAVLDPHNYGRYNGAIITNTNSFETFWKNFASEFKSNGNVIFDTNNEYHDMDQTLVFNLNQAAINGIRAAGATSQTIYVEGNSWTGAATWAATNDNLKNLKDPQNKLVYEMHLYLDSDSSGTHTDCASSTIGVQRATSATAWLKANGKVGVIGEFGGGPNPTCMSAVTGLLNYLAENSGQWEGALVWAAGPWWGSGFLSYEPPTGTEWEYYHTLLQSYA